MTKNLNGRSWLHRSAPATGGFEIADHIRAPQRTFAEVRDDMRIRRALQRAVGRETAPGHLVDAIRNMIRE